jgi:hypothetical protein
MCPGQADLDFPSFPVRPIYFPVTAKKFPVPASREFACKSLLGRPFLRRSGPLGTTIGEIPGYLPGSREFAGCHGRLVRGRAAVYILPPPVPDRGMPGAIVMPTAYRDD